MNARLFRPSLLVVAVATALAGCGGGGHNDNNNSGGGSTTSGLNVTSQPKSTTAAVGGTATFSVTISGSNVSYQWYKNGTAIAGATSSTYTTPTLTDADDGATFFVIAKNDSGSVKSDVITLTLGTAGSPTITGQPASTTSPVGSSASFSVVATGTAPLTYQWYKGTDKISGATNSTYTITSVTASSAGTYHVVVTNANGSVTSADATLTIGAATAPSITTQPASQTVRVGATATFSVVASGTGPLSYQWYYNGVAISGATSQSYSVTTNAGSGGSYYVVVTNSVGTVQSNTVTLTVISAPTITQQPTSVTVFSTQTVTLSVTATGGNLSYQWYKGGTAISGATSATYTFTAQANPSNAGSYKVVVSNIAGSVTSDIVTVTVNPPPTITTQPSNVSAGEGSTATFTVGATGSGLSFQWYKNGTAVSGATSTGYTTGTLTLNDSGATYYCVVSNPAGSVTSNSATLTVVAKPTITSQPSNQSVSSGSKATFTVVATVPSGGTLSYQWFKVGSTTVLSTAASYTTPATDSSYNGNQYYCRVYNQSVAYVDSNTVTLTVQ